MIPSAGTTELRPLLGRPHYLFEVGGRLLQSLPRGALSQLTVNGPERALFELLHESPNLTTSHLFLSEPTSSAPSTEPVVHPGIISNTQACNILDLAAL